jgi:hypothetical protein
MMDEKKINVFDLSQRAAVSFLLSKQERWRTGMFCILCLTLHLNNDKNLFSDNKTVRKLSQEQEYADIIFQRGIADRWTIKKPLHR